MQITRITLRAPAKINLFLHILGKREDGYHELETLMQKISLYDELELGLVAEPGVRMRCSTPEIPTDERNIAVRAAQLFLSETGNSDQGINIVLKKNIPIAAGLGGGSSDAAAVLNGLDQLLQTACSTEQRAAMGVRLGADVPLFVYDFPAALATGIGERLIPASSLTDYKILLVNPGISVSTQWAYEAFSSAAGKIALTAKRKAFILSCSKKSGPKFAIPDDLKNDLEQVTAKRYPVIRELKDHLLRNGAAGAMMSGSGSTVFGLFHRKVEEKAEQCRYRLEQEYDQVCLVSPLTDYEAR